MPRPIWSGAISFGLVNVPVRLYAAVQSRDVRFHQLHGKDKARVRQQRVCLADGQEVSYDELVKGYEVSPDRYVTVTDEELEGIAPKATRSIEIEEFVDAAELDPMLYEHSYLLLPERSGVKPYALLLEAMRAADKVALGRVVLRTKQYLAAIRPTEDVLVLSTMVFADEVVDQDEIDGLGGEDADERELELARNLVASLSGSFEVDSYQDDYRQRLLDLIEAKSKGIEVVHAPEPEERSGEVVDLMAALEASLAAAREGEGKDDRKPHPKRRARKER
jgi:DNA end-binding protein Ku